MEVSKLVAWLRAPAFSPNALMRPAEEKGLLARLSLAPLLFLAFATVAITLVFTTEIYTVREGIGDDGVIYAAIIRAYNGHVQALGLNGYTAQRVLNPIVVRLGMNLFHVPVDTRSIVMAYKVANAISIAAALACAIASARYLRLSRAGLLAVPVLTYFNFATLYWLPFDPVLTDGMALAVGALQLWAYVSRRYVILALVSCAGGFIWPSSAQVGAALLFFARPPADAGDTSTVPSSSRPTALDTAIAALLAAVMTWYASTLVDYVPPYGQVVAIKSLFRLSCGLLCVMTFIALKELVRVGPSLRELVRRDRDAIVGKVLAFVTLLLVTKGLHWVAAAPTRLIPQAADFKVEEVLKGAIFFAVNRPLAAVVAHVGFYGPAILLMIFCWRAACDGARRLGFGLNAVLGIAFFLLLNSQSRGALQLIPIVLPLAAVAAARLPWTPRRLWELAAVTFIASKLWYTIVQKPAIDFSTLMFHVGSWMPQDAYLIQGVALIFAATWVLWVRRQRPPPEETVWLCEEQPTSS